MTDKKELIPMNPAGLLEMAVQQGADLDKMEKLMDLKERWDKDEARKSYIVAMSDFKADPPELFKDKHVSYATSKGVTQYDHASLGVLSSVIGEALAKHGLSHRWDIDQIEGGMIKVTCVITHVAGHSESVPMQSGADQSGGKNNIQALGSTTTYLQRYTLLSAVGLATKDMDNDGQTSEPIETISETQVTDLLAKIKEVGANEDQFLKVCKIESFDQLPANKYNKAINILQRRNKDG